MPAVQIEMVSALNKPYFLAMGRRRKNRTHLKGAGAASATAEGAPNAPKTFIVKHGHVGSSVAQLVRDMRKVMEPNTATRLRVSEDLGSIRIISYFQSGKG